MAYQQNKGGSKGTLGTFAGVFTPSILTILGIILFLRLGYVVGHAGLGSALLILVLANGISVLTSFSLSAIATNLNVKGGGDYYVISRTLGHEFGGAIGIVVFLAQSISIAFYCLGFGEVVARLVYADAGLLPRIIAAAAVSLLFILAWMGADWATRFQYVVMAVLSAAIISFLVGGFISWNSDLLAENWSAPQTTLGFWALFAIFFPAVTGFTQGVSMSGDLSDPGRSLPLGTFLAVGVSIVVYFVSSLLFAAALPADVMMNDYAAMKKVAIFAPLVAAGVIAATLSSAMASFLGAPRILQSLAADKIIPILNPLARGAGPTSNPRRGVLLSAGIAYITIGFGELNLIAPVVSMFFLISYGLLNYATYYEARSQSPSFRPRFRYYHKWLSLAGALACLATMLAVDLTSGIIAVAVLFAIFQYLRRTAGPARWADSRRSYHLHRSREHLLAVATEPEHPRDWRPQILAFSEDSQRRAHLLEFASWIEGESGLTTSVRILEGRGTRMRTLKKQAEEELQRDINKHKFNVFPRVVVAPSLQIGIESVIQSYGIGALKANTILLNWLGRWPNRFMGIYDQAFPQNLRAVNMYDCNLVMLDVKADKWDALFQTEKKDLVIDIWWSDDTTGHLMLMMAYLMTRSELWNDAQIRLLALNDGQSNDQAVANLKQFLEDVRIEAEPEIIEAADTDSIVEYSADSSLVFLPFRLQKHKIVDAFGNPIEDDLFLLPLVAMVMAAEALELTAEPEEGEAAEKAHILDMLAAARKREKDTVKAAVAAIESAKKAKEKLQKISAASDQTDEAALKEAEAAAGEAEKQANKLARKAARAVTKAEVAAKNAEALGIFQEEPDGDQ